MAKFELRIKARKLRKKGLSVKEIAGQLGVAKSTTSLWVRDIILTVEQLERLRNKMIAGSERGRLKGALIQKQKRLKKEEIFRKTGVGTVGDLGKREILLTGLALYWAEGSKKRREVSFCNSDPRLVNFMIRWLRSIYKVQKYRLIATVGINEIHEKREDIVKKYWVKVTGLPLSQFRKTSFKKSRLKKVYENYDSHYGTLRIKVLKPADLYYKIMGQIDALARQGSSVG